MSCARAAGTGDMKSEAGFLVATIAMVTLDHESNLSMPDIFHDLRTTWPELAPSNPDDRENILAFDLGTGSVAIGEMPAPIPWAALEGPCATTVLFPDAAQALNRHTRHLIVTLFGEPNAIASARLLTQVVAAVVHTCSAATGVFWGSAGLVIRPDVFRDFAVDVLPEQLPLQLWIDFRVGLNPNGTSYGFTQGLTALGFTEFETEYAPERPTALRDRLIALADYVIDNGPVIQDGHTVGSNAGEKIRVRYEKSEYGNPERVLRLDYETPEATPKHRWWKLN